MILYKVSNFVGIELQEIGLWYNVRKSMEARKQKTNCERRSTTYVELDSSNEKSTYSRGMSESAKNMFTLPTTVEYRKGKYRPDLILISRHGDPRCCGD